MTTSAIGLYDPARESSACGVGFITRKDGRQDHDVIVRGEQALCAIPHRGGMSSEGVGDGAGVSIDLSVRFFSDLTGQSLRAGTFGVANLFLPTDPAYADRLASFTSISGPSLDMAAVWLRGGARRPGAALTQLAHSYYIGLFQLPVLPELAARRGLVGALVTRSARAGTPWARLALTIASCALSRRRGTSGTPARSCAARW